MAKKKAFVAPPPPLSGPAHTTENEVLVKDLGSDIQLGLSEDKIADLQSTYGPNQIRPPPKPSVS